MKTWMPWWLILSFLTACARDPIVLHFVSPDDTVDLAAHPVTEMVTAWIPSANFKERS